jgi:hypothetical protein
MHDTKKTAILKRFADLIIEYSSVEDMAGHRIEARVLDHLENQYGYWDNSYSPKSIPNSYPIQQPTGKFGRQYYLPIEHPIKPRYQEL